MAEPPPKVRPLPLFAWEQDQRAHHARRCRLRRRGVLLAFGIAALAGTIALSPRPRLLWNASASAPVGLYAIGPVRAPERGDMVIAWPPAWVRDLAARRRYLPRGVPLVKRVAAVAGDRVCASDTRLTINGQLAANRRRSDGVGRPLPHWQGCYRLTPGQLLLLMTRRADSFDGRYFGVSQVGDLVGTATPLWLP